jgi:hypothetical protein
MFFRRERTPLRSFSDLLNLLKPAGFSVETLAGGKAKVHRDGFAALLESAGDDQVRIMEAGLALGSEIAILTDVGFQKIFATDTGKQAPALAEHLKALHVFVEDLRETIGITSLYNESLGTTNERHLYDRVVSRDLGVPKRPWQR